MYSARVAALVAYEIVFTEMLILKGLLITLNLVRDNSNGYYTSWSYRGAPLKLLQADEFAFAILPLSPRGNSSFGQTAGKLSRVHGFPIPGS